jgi:glycosyltransferase involved in cell wall biosynthesis
MVKISVIMAVYNGSSRLRETLASIAAQTEPDFELIVVDDGSTDDTPHILASFPDPRLRVITQPNAGLTRALIRGCAEARADAIARHDSGDRSHPDRFRRQLALLDQHVLVAAATRMRGPAAEELYISRGDGDEVRRSLLHDPAARIHGIPHHASSMFRREDYLAAGGYREAFRFAQDLDLWIRLASGGPIAIVDEVLYEATLEPSSISSIHRREQEELTRLAVALRDSGDDAEPALLAEAARVLPSRKASKRDEAAGLYFIAKCLRRQHDRSWRRYLLRALARNPLHLRSWASLLLGR